MCRQGWTPPYVVRLAHIAIFTLMVVDPHRYFNRYMDARYQNDALVDPHRDPIRILCQWLIFNDGCASDPLT